MKRKIIIDLYDIVLIFILIITATIYISLIPRQVKIIIDIAALLFLFTGFFLVKKRKTAKYYMNVTEVMLITKIWRPVLKILFTYVVIYVSSRIALLFVPMGVPVFMDYIYWCLLGIVIGTRVVLWRFQNYYRKIRTN